MTKIKGSCSCGGVGLPDRFATGGVAGDGLSQSRNFDDTSWVKSSIDLDCETAQRCVTIDAEMENHDRMMPF